MAKASFLTTAIVTGAAYIVAAPLAADEPRWVKFRQTVSNHAAEQVGEFTVVMTVSDGLVVEKIFFKSETGQHLVLESSGRQDGSGLFHKSFRRPESVEELGISFPAEGEFTVQFESGQFTFAQSEAGQPSVLQSGQTLLTAATPTFLDALRDFAVVACGGTITLHPYGSLLGGMLYNDLGPCNAVDGLESDPSAIVKDFDPGQFAPGQFEAEFGQEYFELPSLAP